MFSVRLIFIFSFATIFLKESLCVGVDNEDRIPEKYFEDIYKIVNRIPFDTNVARDFQVIDDHVTYHLFTRENTERYINVDPSNPVELNTIKKIVFIIHGWTENRSRRWYNELKNALLRTGDVYVVQVDYEEPAAQDYVAAVLSVPDIANIIANLILKLNNDYNIPLGNIELIGHSLGAQVSGFVGKEIIRNKNEKLKKIVALDTAGPLWIGENRLLATDAEIVESIHTNNILGFSGEHGTVDFYPNGAELLQPGCLESSDGLYNAVFCSHHRSYWFYIESLNSGGFTSKRCSSWLFYQLGFCNSNEELAFNKAKEGDTGNYYLRTSDTEPYSID